MTLSQRNTIISLVFIACLVVFVNTCGFLCWLMSEKVEAEVSHYRNLERMQQEALEKPIRVEYVEEEK